MMRSASSLRPLSTITGTGVLGAHLPQHVETAHLRQTEVEHDELGRVVGDLVERGRAVAGVVDREPLPFEGVRTTSTRSRSSSTTRIVTWVRLGGHRCRQPGSADAARAKAQRRRPTARLTSADVHRADRASSSTSSAPWPAPRPRWASTRSSPATATPSPTTCRRCGGAATSTAASTWSSPAAATTTWPGSGSGWSPCCTRPTSTPASTRRSSPTCTPGGPCGCSRPTTRCPACSTTLRRAGVGLAICSNWDWDLEPAVAETGLDGWFDTLVSSAWAGARKPHPRIYRYLLEQTGLDPAEMLFVGDTWGPDVEGPARGGDDAGLPRARRALARRDRCRPTPRTIEVTRLRDLRGVLPLVGAD